MPDVYPARYPLIAICDPPNNRFSYVQERRQGGSEVGFWLGIRKKALRRWYQSQKENSGLKLVDIVNENIPKNSFKIKPESKRVEKLWTYHCSLNISIQKKNLIQTGVDPVPNGLRTKKKLSRS